MAVGRAIVPRTLVHGGPLVQCCRPAVRDFRQQRNSRPHVLTAFVVVGGGREHVPRPVFAQVVAVFVELVRGDTEQGGLGADLVARQQPVETVEGRVFHSFRHHRRRQLLPLADESELLLVQRLLGQQPLEELEDGTLDVGAREPGIAYGFGNHPPVCLAHLCGRPIGAINPQGRSNLRQGIAYLPRAQVTGLARLPRNANCRIGEAAHDRAQTRTGRCSPSSRGSRRRDSPNVR
jgi:hypothetical protein